MVIKAFKTLSALRKTQIASLEAEAARADGAAYPLFSDTFLNYTKEVPAFFFATSGNRALGVLSLFLPGDGTAEISALVSPSYRNRGLFSMLLGEAAKSLKALGCTTVYIVSNPRIKAGAAVLEKLPVRYSSSEYKMILPDAAIPLQSAPPSVSESSGPKTRKNIAAPALSPILTRLSSKDFLSLKDLFAELFDIDENAAETWLSSLSASDSVRLFRYEDNGKLIGCAGFVESVTCCSVFSVGIREEYRGKGLGKRLMLALLKKIPAGKAVILQVSDKNPVAFSLYGKLGFAIESTTVYHVLERF
jgi:ribosomal protein S18 acetylase RimI-like enzyme